MHIDGTLSGLPPAVLIAAVVVGGAFTPATAHAAGERFDGRSFALEAQVGQAMPLGYYGLALDVSLSRHLVIAGGAGFGYEGYFGTQPQGMLGSRLRYPLGGGWAVAAGAGVSLGGYVQTTLTRNAVEPQWFEVSEQQWLPALRLNGELSLEYRFANPVSVRVFGGAGRIVNEPHCLYNTGSDPYEGACRAPGIPERHLAFDRTRAFVGVALAYQIAGDSAGRFAPWAGRPPVADTARWQRWYGWQTLAVDAAGFGLLYAAYQQRPKTEWARATQGAGAAIYFAGAPVVHVVQRRHLRSVFSVVARLVLPVVGSLLYAAAVTAPYECSSLDCPAFMGAYVGAVGASIADAALLAYR